MLARRATPRAFARLYSQQSGPTARNARSTLRDAAPQRRAPLWTPPGRTFSSTPRRPLVRRTLHALRALRQQDPILMPVGMVLLAAGVASFAYIVYVYTVVYGPIEHNYPEAVAKKLKRALYYTNVAPDLPKAMRMYQQALQLCDEEGMNPFGEQVVGIRIQLAAALEHAGQPALAVRALDSLRDDLRAWVAAAEARPDTPPPPRERTRILKQLVAIGVRLGQLRAALDDPDAAERDLEDALDGALREQTRREKEAVDPEVEGDWLSAEETGATIEELAYHFDRRGRFQLASVLFLRALTLGPPPCHAAMLMNNLATAIAQSSPSAASASSTAQPPTSRAALLQDAQAWARKAIDVARAVPAADRVAECDVACATATHNLGEFAEMAGAVAEARGLYAEAARLAKDAGFAEGRQQAHQALKRLGGEGR